MSAKVPKHRELASAFQQLRPHGFFEHLEVSAWIFAAVLIPFRRGEDLFFYYFLVCFWVILYLNRQLAILKSPGAERAFDWVAKPLVIMIKILTPVALLCLIWFVTFIDRSWESVLFAIAMALVLIWGSIYLILARRQSSE